MPIKLSKRLHILFLPIFQKCYLGLWFTSCWQTKLLRPVCQAPNWCLLLPHQQQWPYEPKRPLVDLCTRSMPVKPGQLGRVTSPISTAKFSVRESALSCVFSLAASHPTICCISFAMRSFPCAIFTKWLHGWESYFDEESHLKLFLGWERLLWNLLVQNKLYRLHEDVGLTWFVKLYQKYIRFVRSL